MATSGENVQMFTVAAECTAPTTLFRFDVLCNFTGTVDLHTDTDGSAIWVCPSCNTTHNTHITDWDT